MSRRNLKLAVLGASGVGKSAMIVRFITGRFLHHYDPTLEDEYCVETMVEGQLCNVSILDTAGVEETSSDSTNYLGLVDAVLVVFSLESQPSLDVARQLLKTSRNLSLPAVIVGTKCDLHSHLRVLSYDDALVFAHEYGCTYVETSSAVNINILEAFQTAIGMAIKQTGSSSEPSSSLNRNVVEKKHKRRVRSIWSRLGLFKREKKLLDSLAVSANPVEVDIMRLSSAH